MRARMSRIALALMVALMLFDHAAAAGRRRPRPDLLRGFAIGLHAGVTIEEADFLLAADAGFNLVLPQRPGADYSRALLNACRRSAMKGVVWDPRLATCNVGGRKLLREALRLYRRSSALAGYVVSNYLSAPPAHITTLASRVRELGAADRRRFRYLEALHLREFSGEDSYTRYLDHYLNMGTGYVLYEEDDPFSAGALKAMQAVSKTCRRRGNIWWRRCRLQNISDRMIRWQAYSAAAGGARGVIYLVTRPVPGYRTDSLLTVEGRPGAAYDAARATNRRLYALSPTLTAIRPSTFYTTGSMPEGSPPCPDDSPVASIASDVEDDGFLVGLFKDGGQHVFIVRKPSDAPDAAQVTIQWAANRQGTVVETGDVLDGPLSLLPGEGQLLRVETRQPARE